MSVIPFILVLFDGLFAIFKSFTDAHAYHTLVQQVGRQERLFSGNLMFKKIVFLSNVHRRSTLGGLMAPEAGGLVP